MGRERVCSETFFSYEAAGSLTTATNFVYVIVMQCSVIASSGVIIYSVITVRHVTTTAQDKVYV